MSHNTSSSKRTVWNKFGSTSTNASSQVPAKQQLQTYTDHYRGRWIGKKSDFVNIPIYTYENLGSIRHIMVDRPAQLSTNTTTTEFTIAEQPWLELYKKRCELEVYCWWHGLRVPKAQLVELPRDEPTNILARLERENNQMQWWLDRFHAVQKVRKHLSGNAQKRAIKSIKEITTLDDDIDISDFSDSSNDDFQKFLPTKIRHCC